MLVQAEERPGQLRQPIEAVARLPLPTARYEAELAACAGLDRAGPPAAASRSDRRSGGPGGLPAPIDELAERLRDVVRLFQQGQRGLEHAGGSRPSGRRSAAQGLLLVEPEGNPDPLVEQGRTQHAALLQALERGDTKAAAGHLDQALALAEQAQTVIERQAAAREQCAAKSPPAGPKLRASSGHRDGPDAAQRTGT